MSNKNIMNRMKNEYPFEKKAGWLAAYLLCGGLAALSLLTAPMGHHEVRHMIVTTLGIFRNGAYQYNSGDEKSTEKIFGFGRFPKGCGNLYDLDIFTARLVFGYHQSIRTG